MNWSMQTIDPLVRWVNIMNWSVQTIDSRQLGQYYELVNADYRPSRQLGQYYELVNADYRLSRQLGQYYELVSADYRPSCQLGQYELVSMVMQYSDSTHSILLVSTDGQYSLRVKEVAWPGPVVSTDGQHSSISVEYVHSSLCVTLLNDAHSTPAIVPCYTSQWKLRIIESLGIPGL